MAKQCDFCAAECCKNYIITVTSFDILRIMEKTGKKPDEFAAITPMHLIKYDNSTVLECYRGKDRYDYVLTLKSHPCYFLDKNNKCSIHSFSPLCCRLYPHGSHGKMLKTAACPIIPGLGFRVLSLASRVLGKGLDTRQYTEQMDAYKKIVSDWNRLRCRTEDCMDFLLKESKNARQQRF